MAGVSVGRGLVGMVQRTLTVAHQRLRGRGLLRVLEKRKAVEGQPTIWKERERKIMGNSRGKGNMRHSYWLVCGRAMLAGPYDTPTLLEFEVVEGSVGFLHPASVVR